jgi:hypothetical protein
MSQARKNVNLDDTITWSGKQLASEIDGEVVLMNIDRGHYYSLDDIGSEIWRAIEQPVLVRALCRSCVEKYHADSETVSADVLALLDKMLEQELITVVSA